MTGVRNLLPLMVLLPLLGCGKAGNPAVSGVANYQGKPVEGATVTFHSADGKGGAYFGRTDAAGRYQLAGGTVPGVPAGKYNVTVSKVVTSGGEVKEIAPGVLDPNPKLGKTTYAIPVIYTNPATSGLSVEVKPGDKNAFPLDLK